MGTMRTMFGDVRILGRVSMPSATLAKILFFAARVRAMGSTERNEAPTDTRGEPEDEHEG